MRDIKKLPGKRVWLWNETAHYLDFSKMYTITEVVGVGCTLPDGSINNDWCEHFILTKGKKTIDCKGYLAIITPDENLPIGRRVYEYLCDNGLSFDECSANEATAIVSITWGDWKHEHGFCNSLMKYLGYTLFKEAVTEENGSDTYSSIHYFKK